MLSSACFDIVHTSRAGGYSGSRNSGRRRSIGVSWKGYNERN
jgi:hypothetical protein